MNLRAALRSSWKKNLLAGCLSGCLALGASANIYNVTNTVDAPGTVSPLGGGIFNASTLRAAINAANAVAGPHTINIPPGTYTLTLGELVIGTNSNLTVTLNGTGTPANTIVQHDLATPVARVLDLDPFLLGGINITIQNLTLAHGRNNDGLGGAGIICGFQGPPSDSTTLINCVLLDNLITGGLSGAVGGAIQNIGGILIINNCRFEGNSAGNFSGGAIYYDSHSPSVGGFQVSNSLFVNNTAGDNANGGGALFAAAVAGSSPFSISGSTFTSNRVTSATGNGGALIKFGSASLAISNSTFLNNQVLGNSAVTNSASGGAIDNAGGPMTIQFCRLAGNSAVASGHGNAINNAAGSATLTAENNWWASNAGPGADLSGASVAAWLKLTHYANPASINLNNSTTLTASFLTNSAGAPLTLANLSTLIGLPISFSNAVKGILSSPQTIVQASGTATATFTAGNIPGAAGADAIFGSAVATAPINIICPTYTGTLTGGASICAGSSAPVTVTINSSFGPYVVTLNNGGGSKTNFSPLIFNVTPGVSTTYSVLTASDSNNCPVNVTGSATINVASNTGAVILPTAVSVCANSSGNQASAPPGLAGYAWSISNGTITSPTTGQTIAYTAGPAGAVTLSVIVSNVSGCTASGSTNITINASPAPLIATSPAALCPGAPGNQSSVPSAYASYSWTISNGAITGPTNLPMISFVAGSPGNTILQVALVNSNGCSATISTNLSILPAPATLAGCSLRTNYFANQTFSNALGPVTMTMAFDGTNYWSCSGNDASGNRLARYDSNGVLIATYAPGLDFRSVFTDGNCALLARAYADPTIYRQVAPGVFAASGVSLSGGSLDSQSSVVFNGRSTEYIALSNGVVSRWSPAGQYLGQVNLLGFGSVPGEDLTPQNRGIGAVGDFWLTYNGSGILSVWDSAGNRLMQSVLSAAGISFDSRYSFSYANGKVFLVDATVGLWRGYDVCNAGSVAVFGTPGNMSWNADVRSKILAQNSLPLVDVFYANPVPTLAALRRYQAVLVYSDAGFDNSTALGNALADYIDLGGGVTVATFAYWSGNALAIQGRMVTGGYLPFTTAAQTNNNGLTLVKDQPAHPILNGVNSFDGGSSSYHNSPISIAPGAALLAHWTDGQPLVGAREFALGRIAGLNFYPPSSSVGGGFWLANTDGGKLMANSLLWTAKMPPTILAGPASQPASPGSNVTFTVFASGAGPLIYQWRKDGTNLPGANTSSLSITVQTGSAGKYLAVVSNPYGAAFSSIAALYPQLRFLPPAPPATGAFPLLLANTDGTPLVSERIPQIRVFKAGDLGLPFSNWFQLGGSLVLTNGLIRVDAPGSAASDFFRAVEMLP